MDGFEEGVTFYTMAHAHIRIGFPERRVVCQYCPLLKYEGGYDRHKCIVTDEYIFSYKTARGRKCPLHIESGD